MTESDMVINMKPELELEIFLVGRVVPSVIPASRTWPILTKGEVMVGGCSGGKYLVLPMSQKDSRQLFQYIIGGFLIS